MCTNKTDVVIIFSYVFFKFTIPPAAKSLKNQDTNISILKLKVIVSIIMYIV